MKRAVTLHRSVTRTHLLVLVVVVVSLALASGSQAYVSTGSIAAFDRETAPEGENVAFHLDADEDQSSNGFSFPDASRNQLDTWRFEVEGAVPEPRKDAVPQDVQQRIANDGRFRLPLQSWDIVTDRFGAPRGNNLVHGGIDLALGGRPGSPVVSSCVGAVSVASENASYGNYVMVDCGDGWSTLYGHLSSILVPVGKQVTWGDVLGLSGNTGFSTGEHLHFEIRYQGTPVNPEDYLDFKIPPGTPISIGPIPLPPTVLPGLTPTPSPTTSRPSNTPPNTAEGATPTEGTSPTPGGTPTGTPEPTPEPTLSNFSYIERSWTAIPADSPAFHVVAAPGIPAALRAALVVNRVPGPLVPYPTQPVATVTCEGCLSAAVLVQVNVVPSGWGGSSRGDRAVRATVDVSECSSCSGYAYAVEITVPVANVSAPLPERTQALVNDLRRYLAEFGSLQPGVGGNLATIQAMLEYIGPAYPELATSMVVDIAPQAELPTPTPTPTLPPEPTPTVVPPTPTPTEDPWQAPSTPEAPPVTSTPEGSPSAEATASPEASQTQVTEATATPPAVTETVANTVTATVTETIAVVGPQGQPATVAPSTSAEDPTPGSQ